MYVIGIFLLLAILLGAVMTVLDSVLDTLKLRQVVRGLPLIGANLTIIVSVLIVWLLDARVLEGWGWSTDKDWLTYMVNGVIVCGMIPVKDAVVSAINKGLRA